MHLMFKNLQARLSGPIAKGSIGSLANRIFSVALAFITSILLARILGVEGFGAYSFTQAVIEILLPPAMLGIPMLLVREIPAGLHLHGTKYVFHMIRQSLAIVFVFSCLLGIAGYVITQQYGGNLQQGMSEPLLIGFIMLPFFALAFSSDSVFRGIGRVISGQIPLNIIRPSVVLLIVLLAIEFLYPLDATTVMLINLFATLCALITFSFLWIKFRPNSTTQNNTKKTSLRHLIKTGIPFTLIAGFSVLNNQTDIIMLGIMMGSEETGLYRVAHRLAITANFPLGAILMPFAPVISELFAQGKAIALRQRTTVALRYSFVGVVSISAFLVFFSGFFLDLFGSGFSSASNVLWILCIGQTINVFVIISQTILSMTGHERLVAWNMAMGALINIALNAILIPTHGIEGAATATVLSSIFISLFLHVSAKRRLGFNPSSLLQPKLNEL